MPLSWAPNLIRDSSFVWTPGDDLSYGIFTSDADTSDVLFIYTPDVCSLSVELFTERARHVLPNSSPIGNIRFSVWTLDGPNSDTDLSIIVDGGPDPWVSWTVCYGQLPFVGAEIVVDVDVDAVSTYDLATSTGPVLGCVASLDGLTDPTVTYPGDHLGGSRNYTHSGDTVEGDLTVFASDLPGTFTVDSLTMRRLVLVGPPAAGGWHVGKAGWGGSW